MYYNVKLSLSFFESEGLNSYWKYFIVLKLFGLWLVLIHMHTVYLINGSYMYKTLLEIPLDYLKIEFYKSC